MNAADLQAAKCARALLADPHRWTRGVLARNRWGERCSYIDLQAERWCASGALLKCGGGRGESHIPLRALVRAKGYSDVPEFNDNNSHATVLAALDRVIADGEAEAMAEAEAVLSSDLVEITEEPTLVYA